MGILRGGTTIGGYTALHSGLKEAYIGGNLTLSGNISVGGAATITGALTLGTAGSTTSHAVRGDRTISTGTGLTGGGNFTANRTFALDLTYLDGRYRNSTESFASFDLTGSTSYPRLVANNTGAGSNAWIRVGASGVGLLPYSDGVSQLGTSTWRFAEVHGVTLYENAVSLATKYAARGITLTGGTGITTSIGDLSANRTISLDTGYTDVRYVQSLAGTFTSILSPPSLNYRSAGMYGFYDPAKINHIWSMGTAYSVPVSGADFGTLYGMAYKHSNNTTGGTMAGGHQIVFTNNGTPGVSLGLAGNIWTSGTIYEAGIALGSKYSILSHNHDTVYVNKSGDVMNGTLQFGLNVGLSFPTGSTPAPQVSGNWITGGTDVADLSALNNVAIQTWNGFSVSSTITGQAIPRGVPSFSVDARNGHARVMNEFAVGTHLTVGGSLTMTGVSYLSTTNIYGPTTISTNDNALTLTYPVGDNAYLSYSEAGTRTAYMGFPGNGSNVFTIDNQRVAASTVLSGENYHFKFFGASDGWASIQGDGYGIIKFLTTNRIQFRDSVDTAYSTIYSAGHTAISQRELKKNITLYEEDALHEIVTTPIRYYHFNDDEDWEQKRVGIIVDESPLDAIDLTGAGISEYQMVTMAWKAIQQLAEENKQLKERLSALEQGK